MAKWKNPGILLLLLCILAYCTSAFHFGDMEGALSVCIDLAAPEAIIWPFEISIVGDMGEEGIRIPPKVGSGWSGEAGGEATYRFYVPSDDKYHVWAYAWWFDACSNAVYAQIDTQDKAIIGNDPIFGKWHWTRGYAVRLTEGAHTLKLSNHSDHIALQKILLINSGWVRPENCSIVFSDVFYDGFDGCDIGNFASWESLCGLWKVERPRPEICYIANALLGECTDEATILYEGGDWSDYSFHTAVRALPSDDPNAATGVLFGVQDADNCYELLWMPAEETDTVQMELRRRRDGAGEVLASVEVAWSAEQWHEVEVALDIEIIQVLIDEQLQFEFPIEEGIAGGIGLCLRGEAKAYFDDIHVRTTSDGLTEMD